MEDNKTKPLFTQDAKSADISRSGIRCMGCMELFSAEYELCPKCGYAVGSRAKSPYCLKPGTNLSSRYMLGKVIGQGGFGITYIGWDTAENRRVAIKEFFPNALSTRTEGETLVSCYNEKAENYFKEGVRKMMDEGERLSKFSNHPNIVNVCDSFEENNTAYIVMEYLDGKSLKEYADEKGGRISPEEAVRLMMPVLDALNAMHRENMIHRDIAPDNICICNDGNIKLLDFGSARIAVQDAEKSLSVMVKPGYAPKEQYASRSKQGPWTDVYSVCATLYRLITGEAPVESIERDTTPLKTFASFGITGYDVLENIIVKGLEPDYEKRLRNAEALKNIITKTVLANESRPFAAPVTPAPVMNESQSQKESEPKKKKKPIGIIIAAVIACVVFVVSAGALGIFLLGSQGEPELKGAVRSSGELTDSINWTLYRNGCLLIEGTGDMPDFEGDYETDSTCPWFKDREMVKSVIVEDGVMGISDGAFSDCTSLESITITDSVIRIGYRAFNVCYNLKDVYYGGTEQQWNKINISDAGNDYLLNATIHFNSADETPSEDNNTVTETDIVLVTNALGEDVTITEDVITETPTQAPTEVITTKAAAAEMSQAEFVAFLNAETAKASRGTYNYNRTCLYTSPADVGNFADTIDTIIGSINENSDFNTVMGEILDIGTNKGTYPSNSIKSDYALKETKLKESDIQNFTARGDGVYKFTIANVSNPKKTGATPFSRFTDDFLTHEEIDAFIQERAESLVTLVSTEMNYKNIKVEVKVTDGKIASVKYQYDLDIGFQVKVLVGNILGDCAVKTTGQYTNISY